jgi:parallel beta-helix repeat protein
VMSIGMLPDTDQSSIILVFVIVSAAAVTGVAAVALTGQAGAQTHEIDSCTTISQNGSYELTADIENATNEHCIVIDASNVTFDGNGHEVVATGLQSASAIDATDESNLTVTNVTIRWWGTGVEFWNVTNSTISNVTVERNRSSVFDPGYSIEFNGIELQRGSDNNTIRDNGLYDVGESFSTGASGNGILVDGSNDTRIVDNTVFGPAYTGVRLWNAERTNVSSNTIEGNRFRVGSRYGIQVGLPGDGSSNGTVIRDNDVFGASDFSPYDPGLVDGIAVNEGGNTTVEGNLVRKTADQGIVAGSGGTSVLDNTVRESGDEGIAVFEPADITDNIVRSSGRRDRTDGIRISARADDTRVIGNSITSTFGDGLHVDGVSNLTIRNNSAEFNSDWSVRLTSMPGTETVGSLSLGDTGPITAIGTDFKLRGATLPGVTLPAGQQDIGIVLEAENTSVAGQVRLEASYDDAAVSEVDESTLSMWRYDGAWSEVGGTNGVDTAGNVVFANVTSFSRFVPLADNEPPTVGLTATPTSVTAGEVVTFDASASFDSDGEIVEYRWDFDGDGTVDEVGQSNETTHAYAAGGTYDAAVTVVDDGDDTNTTSATVTVSAVSAPAGEAWPEYGYDGRNTGYAPNNTGPVADATERWSAGVGRIERGSDVLVAGDTVYTEVSPLLAQEPDFVQAVHASNGTPKWSYTPGGNVGNLVLEEGILYVAADGSFEGTIAAVFANTGNVKWSVDRGASSMAVHDGVIYAETDQGLEAFHASNGTQILGFQYATSSDDRLEPPALYNGTLYLSGEEGGGGFVAALDPDDATEQWRISNGSRAFTAPVVRNGTVYAGGPGPANVLHAIDAETGTMEWTRSFEGGFRTRPAVDEGAVYVTSYENVGNLTALDVASGNVLWQRQIGITNTAPAVVSGTVYLGNNSGYATGLDAADGSVRWSTYVTFFGPQSHPAVADGDVYFGSTGDTLHALAEPGAIEPANVSVRIDSTNSPVAPGETLSVNATVENTGGQSETQSVALSIDGTERDSEFVTLNPDESSTITLNWTTTSGDAGSYTAAVGSDDDSDSTAVSVQTQSAPANFSVSIDSTNAPVRENETLNVSATVTNEGDVRGTQTIALSVNGTDRESTSVTLNGSATRVVNLSWTPAGGDAGSYTATVASSNDSASTSITVKTATVSINRAVAGSDGEISLQEIQTAINWWAEDERVPNTGGQTISLQKIQDLINAWAEDQTVPF